MYQLLIVDDQAEQLKKYVRLFQQDFECFTASSGEAAIEIFQQEDPHIILCDVKMPGGMSGFELCQYIKSHSPQTIVVLISSYNNRTSRIKGYESRADEYLNKMTDDEEVYLKVRNLVYTKNNTPASFAGNKANPPEPEESFEGDITAIIRAFYKTPTHLRAMDKIDLTLISKEMHKSNRTIQRIFSKEIGSTFSDFHNQVRFSIAAKLLINSELSIKETAEQLGFCSPSVFSKGFKDMYNMTPSNYRHNYLQEDQE